MFGPAALDSRKERALRFLEEAMELAQAEGVDKAQAVKMTGRVFQGAPGDAKEEAKDAAFTLVAYLASTNQDLATVTLAAIEKAESLSAERMAESHARKKDQGITG